MDPQNTDKDQLLKDLLSCHARIKDLELETGHEKDREAILRAKAIFEGLFEFAPDAIVVVDINGRVKHVNKQAERMFGYSSEDMVGRDHDVLVPQRFKMGHNLSMREYLKKPWPRSMGAGLELYGRKKDGTEFPVDISLGPIDTNGELLVLAVVRDCTEWKEIQKALRESEEHYRKLVELLPDAIAVLTEGKPVFMNQAGARLFGVASAAQLVGKPVMEYVHAEYRELVKERMRKILQEGQILPPAEERFRLHDGTVMDAEVISMPFSYEGKPAMLSIVRDIRERKRAETIIKQSEERSRQTLDRMIEGCQIIGLDWRYLYVNDVAARHGHRTKEELLGHTMMEVYPGIEKTRVFAQLKECMDKRVPAKMENEFTFHDGGKGWFELSVQPAVEGIFILSLDITERKRAEEQLGRTLAELARSNTELEQFAYVASHDLQEPLRLVTNFTQLLEKRYRGKLDQNADEYVRYIIDGAGRMKAMIDDLLSYSRVGTQGKAFEQADCVLLLQQALTNLKMVIEESKAKVTHGPLPVLMLDDTQTGRLFQNLIGNAIKFHREEQPQVHVSARRAEKEWVFAVQDNGIGISREFFDRLFMIFQRLHTRDKYPGTGIGLAMCKKIVERHGGRIWVESEPGKGSTFYFTIPERNITLA